MPLCCSSARMRSKLAPARPAVWASTAAVAAAATRSTMVSATTTASAASRRSRFSRSASPHFRGSRRHNRLPHFQRRPGVASRRVLRHAASANWLHLRTRHLVTGWIIRAAIHAAAAVHPAAAHPTANAVRRALNVSARLRCEAPPSAIVVRSSRSSRICRTWNIGRSARRHS